MNDEKDGTGMKNVAPEEWKGERQILGASYVPLATMYMMTSVMFTGSNYLGSWPGVPSAQENRVIDGGSAIRERVKRPELGEKPDCGRVKRRFRLGDE